MDQLIESRLRKANLTLPNAVKPFGAYANVSQADGLIYVSGMAGFLDGKLIKGIVGDSIDVELHPAHRVFANDKRLRTASGSRQWCLRCFV